MLAALLAAVFIATGCGASAKYESAASAPMAVTEEAAVEEYYGDEMAEMEAGGSGVKTTAEISQTANVQRKLIRTFDLSIQTKEFDEVLSNIQEKVQELGGYIENSSLDGGSAYYERYNRYSNMTVRIPSDKLDGFIANVKETANVTYISESTEDITLRYVDAESRKIALETERDRLLELLEKAETVEDIITIEGRLSEVRYQLESYASQLRTFDNQVDYSTVHINVEEVERYTPQPEKSTWERIKSGFAENVYRVTNGIKNFAIEFVIAIPIMIIWVIGIAVVILLGRKILKKKRQRKEKDGDKQTV
jgi:hypothetical protein